MAQKTVEQLGRQIESFQDEVRKLQQELAGVSKTTFHQSKEALREKGHHLRDTVSGFKSAAGEKTAGALHAVRRGGAGAIEKGRTAIEQKPLAAIMVAFGAGMFLLHLLGRKRS
jgi:ElaB/YqjD/DUF883 family membrane-anchored ribosome-binding protein